ncbi:MAG: hypothetical protein EBZ49_02020 [Proteobacteria bacterium]|nr:hypothetical protein [Pseudomonadota bacterium]
MKDLKSERNFLSEVSMKCHRSFNATSIFWKEKNEIISAISDTTTKSDFFNRMPLRAFLNSFAKKGRDS